MIRLLFAGVIYFAMSMPSLAKDEIDLSLWPKSVEVAKEKSEKNKRQFEQEKKRVVERTKWITHRDPLKKKESETDFLKVELPRRILIDDDGYELGMVIHDLLNSSFSNTIWYEDSQARPISILDKKKSDIEGLPIHAGINKWVKPVRIAFKTLENNYQIDEEKYSYLVKHLRDLIKIYSSASNISIEYVVEDFPRKSDANVYIVLDAKSDIRNAFKNQRGGSFLNENSYERRYISGVRFTPYLRSQVEGFFLPNKKNEIEAATCYLKPALVPESLTKALLNECMARVLGFSEEASPNSATLSNWNRGFDEFSELSSLDDGFFLRKDIKEGVLDFESWEKLIEKDLKKKRKYPEYPNAYDLKMVSMLYCQSIVSGMDKHEVSLGLLSNQNCY